MTSIIRKTGAVLTVLGLALTATVANASLITAKAHMDGAQEPPSGSGSMATGMATVVFDTMSNTLNFMASIHGISLADVTFPDAPLAFGALGPIHIHNAPAGVNGPIVVPFPLASYFTPTAMGFDINATGVPFDAGLISELRAGNLYLNLHTLDSGGGEIRGQLSVPEPATLAILGVGLLALTLVRRKAAGTPRPATC